MTWITRTPPMCAHSRSEGTHARSGPSWRTAHSSWYEEDGGRAAPLRHARPARRPDFPSRDEVAPAAARAGRYPGAWRSRRRSADQLGRVLGGAGPGGARVLGGQSPARLPRLGPYGRSADVAQGAGGRGVDEDDDPWGMGLARAAGSPVSSACRANRRTYGSAARVSGPAPTAMAVAATTGSAYETARRRTAGGHSRLACRRAGRSGSARVRVRSSVSGRGQVSSMRMKRPPQEVGLDGCGPHGVTSSRPGHARGVGKRSAVSSAGTASRTGTLISPDLSRRERFSAQRTSPPTTSFGGNGHIQTCRSCRIWSRLSER